MKFTIRSVSVGNLSRHQAKAGRSMRILIVEDTIDLAEAIAVRLKKLGYAVDTVGDGDEADEEKAAARSR